jgi:hypothetical protein
MNKNDSLYKSINQWLSLIRANQEAQKNSKNVHCRDQTKPQPSLLPHILLSRNNPGYKWPPKLLQKLSKPPPNTIPLRNFPNLLIDLKETKTPFLLELIG